MAREGIPSAVLLDALGTLVELETPWPHLARELRAPAAWWSTRGRARGDARRDGLLPRPPRRGARLGRPRRTCAGAAPASCRSRWARRCRWPTSRTRCWRRSASAPTPRCPACCARLRAGGARLVVVSNWDVSLHDVLERTGLRGARRRRRHLGRARRRQARPGDLPRRARAAGGARPPRRCTSATASRPTSRARARRASRRCSSRATARRRPTACARRLPRRPADDVGHTGRLVLCIRDACPPRPPRSRRPLRRAPELPEGVERPARARGPRWPPWTAWAALVAGFAGALVGALVIGVIARRGLELRRPSPAVSISATVVQDLSLIGAALLFASIAGRPLPEQFGLRPTRFWPAVGWMAAACVAFFVVHARRGSRSSASAPTTRKLPEELGVDDSTVALLAVAFLVAVVAPVAEEFFFRGYFFGALRNWRACGRRRSSPALVFGAIHVGSADAAFLLPLALLRLRAVPAARADRLAVSVHRAALR